MLAIQVVPVHAVVAVNVTEAHDSLGRAQYFVASDGFDVTPVEQALVA